MPSSMGSDGSLSDAENGYSKEMSSTDELSNTSTKDLEKGELSEGKVDGDENSKESSGEIEEAGVHGDQPDCGHDKEFEVTWDGDNDPENPRSLSKARKWLITLVVSTSAFCVTSNSSLYTLTYDQVEPEFHISREVATLGLTTFVLGLAVGPMFLAPLSEFYGRRPVYLGSFAMFVIWILPDALAKNIETILVARFFDGVFGSTFLSVSGGTIGDMFIKSELSMPMMVFSGSPFLGPTIGPVLGGFINQYANWRWSFWVLFIWAGVQWIMIALFIPETYHPVLLRRKARKLRKETGNDAWYAPIEIMDKSILKTILWSCIRPFQLLIFEPMLLNICILSALLLAILYLFFGAFPLVFQKNYDFTLSQVGLTFMGMFVGMSIAIFSDSFWRSNYSRLVQENRGVSEPEFRLPSTIFGAIVVPIGLFGFGWTSYPQVHWIAPVIFSAVFGIGVNTCFAGIFTWTVEAYPLYAASAMAANSFLRSIWAAAFPLFGVQMYDKLGFQWASSLLAFLALAMAPFPYIFFRYGKRIRKASRFA